MLLFPKTDIDGLLARTWKAGGSGRQKASIIAAGERPTRRQQNLLGDQAHTDGSVRYAPRDADTPKALVESDRRACQSCGLNSMPRRGRGLRNPAEASIWLQTDDRGDTGRDRKHPMPAHGAATPRASGGLWGVLADPRRPIEAGAWPRGLAPLRLSTCGKNEGMRAFVTGIKSEHPASQAACAKLGISETEWVTAFCFDDERLAAL